MEKIGLLQGIYLCRQYAKLNNTKREEIRNKRLISLVSRVRETSPFYRELYRDIGHEYTLSDLPPVTKIQLMSQFDQWTADRKAGICR